MTIFGPSVHSAPSGRLGISSGQGSSSSTSIVKAIWVPSGDQRRLPGDCSSRENWVVAPSASIHRTKICGPSGSPGATNAIRVPSGDQVALAPSTSSRFLEPSEFAIHKVDSRRSFILSIQPRLYTTCLPSGDICGPETSSQSKYLSRVNLCIPEPLAPAEAWAASAGGPARAARRRVPDTNRTVRFITTSCSEYDVVKRVTYAAESRGPSGTQPQEALAWKDVTHYKNTGWPSPRTDQWDFYICVRWGIPHQCTRHSRANRNALGERNPNDRGTTGDFVAHHRDSKRTKKRRGCDARGENGRSVRGNDHECMCICGTSRPSTHFSSTP